MLRADHGVPMLGIYPGISERDVAAEGVPNDRDRCQLLLVDELDQVVDVTRHAVASVGRPSAVAVPTEIACGGVPIPSKIPRDPVPIPAMILAAVNEQERRSTRIAPVHVIQAERLRKIDARGLPSGVVDRYRCWAYRRLESLRGPSAEGRKTTTASDRFAPGRIIGSFREVEVELTFTPPGEMGRA